MNKESIIIGKLRYGANYVLEVDTISRRHAELFYQEEQIKIKDLGSQNGTYVNGVLLLNGIEKELKVGDHVMLADLPYELGNIQMY